MLSMAVEEVDEILVTVNELVGQQHGDQYFLPLELESFLFSLFLDEEI